MHARVPSTVIYVTHDQVEAMTLADRIVIMRDGLIEQVGTPEDVFHRPATRFVGGFIGSPAMNILDAEITDGRIVFGNGDWLPIPDRFRQAQFAERRVAVGMRPDDVYPTGHGLPSASGSQVVQRELPVSVTEPLGNETLVFVQFRRTGLGGAHAQSDLARTRADDRCVVRSRKGASLFDRRRARGPADRRVKWRRRAHFLMEPHVGRALRCVEGKYAEYIPALEELTASRLTIENGTAMAPTYPGRRRRMAFADGAGEKPRRVHRRSWRKPE